MSGTIHIKPLTPLRDWNRGEGILANGGNGGLNRTHNIVRELRQGVDQPRQVPSVARGEAAATGASTRTFRLDDATPDDWLLCTELDNSGGVLDNRERDQDGNPIGEIPAVKVAKTRELQRTHQDNQRDMAGRWHVFDGSLLQVVSRLGVTETWVPIPEFWVGDQIQAEEVVYSGALDGSTDITLQDTNRAGRAWAVKSE